MITSRLSLLGRLALAGLAAAALASMASRFFQSLLPF